jgi:hypothetical protein
VQVLTRDGQGSGVKIAAGLLTNDHVVGDADQVEIINSTGQHAQARVVKTDPLTDLALLQTDLPLPVLDTEPAVQQQQGDAVLVLGYPMADTVNVGGSPQATLTRGLISAFRSDAGVTYIQTDAAFNPGNSGGALLNMRGHLIGIPESRQGQGLNFALATETVQAFVQAPITTIPDAARIGADFGQAALTLEDLGPDWTSTDLSDDYLAALNLANRSDVFVNAFALGDPESASSYAYLFQVLTVRPTALKAHNDYLRATRSMLPLQGPTTDPGVGDECRAASASRSGTVVSLVVCRLDNAVVVEVLAGTDDLVPADQAAYDTGLVTQRLRDQAS